MPNFRLFTREADHGREGLCWWRRRLLVENAGWWVGRQCRELGERGENAGESVQLNEFKSRRYYPRQCSFCLSPFFHFSFIYLFLFIMFNLSKRVHMRSYFMCRNTVIFSFRKFYQIMSKLEL